MYYYSPLSCPKFCRRTLRRRQPLTRLPGRACQYCTKHKRLVVPEPRRHRCQSPTVHRKHNTIWLYIIIYIGSAVSIIIWYYYLVKRLLCSMRIHRSLLYYICIMRLKLFAVSLDSEQRVQQCLTLYKHTKSHLIIPRGSSNIVIILLDIVRNIQ